MFSLIDGSGFLFRAYYGLPPLTNAEGQNINVVFGFVKMMTRLLLEQPQYFLIARDMPRKTLRHEQFADYKGTRTAIPDEFKQQIPRVKELIGRLGIPSLGVEGYEADDVIGTYAKFASGQGIFTTIYSSDKDLKQLITPQIVCKDPMKWTTTTVESFHTSYGFPPEQMMTYLSLLGDSSDNIPGVFGIGEKGAQTLVQQYGTLDNIYTHIDEIGGKTKEKLLTGRDSAYQSQSLVRLMDVPQVVELGLAACTYKFDLGVRRKVLVGEWGFSSIGRMLDDLEKQHGDTKIPGSGSGLFDEHVVEKKEKTVMPVPVSLFG